MSMHHSFDIEHAQIFGLEEAILISNLQFWIGKNVANGAHHHDGRTWTYNSAKAYALLFPYLSDRQIRRTIDSLEEQGVVMKGSYNASPCDRTLWLAFVDEQAFLTIQKPAPKSANGAPKSAKGKTKPAPKSANGCAEIGESLISTDINTDVNLFPAPPAGALAAVEVAPVKVEKTDAEKAAEAKKQAQVDACRATWDAYDTAYYTRYRAAPVRNATVNSQIVNLVKRVGVEAPFVAAFYVSKVNDKFVVGKCHPLGLLLKDVEGYRTQWARGQAITSTQAQQIDKSQSNFDAAEGAKALWRARREQKNAE